MTSTKNLATLLAAVERRRPPYLPGGDPLAELLFMDALRVAAQANGTTRGSRSEGLADLDRKKQQAIPSSASPAPRIGKVVRGLGWEAQQRDGKWLPWERNGRMRAVRISGRCKGSILDGEDRPWLLILAEDGRRYLIDPPSGASRSRRSRKRDFLSAARFTRRMVNLLTRGKRRRFEKGFKALRKRERSDAALESAARLLQPFAEGAARLFRCIACKWLVADTSGRKLRRFCSRPRKCADSYDRALKMRALRQRENAAALEAVLKLIAARPTNCRDPKTFISEATGISKRWLTEAAKRSKKLRDFFAK